MNDGRPSAASRSERWQRVFGAVFLVAGVFLFGVALRSAQATFEARAWNEGQCTMIHAELRRGMRVKRRHHHHLDVRYAYRVADVHYEGTRWSPASQSLDIDLDNGRDLLSTLTPGSRHACWIHPSDPTQAVLDRSMPSAVWWLPLLGLAFGWLGFKLLRGRSGS